MRGQSGAETRPATGGRRRDQGRPILWLESAVYPVAEELDIAIRPRTLAAIARGHLFAGELLIHALGVVGVGHIGDVVQRYARRPHVLDVHGSKQGADVPGKTNSVGHVVNSGYVAVARYYASPVLDRGSGSDPLRE